MTVSRNERLSTPPMPMMQLDCEMATNQLIDCREIEDYCVVLLAIITTAWLEWVGRVVARGPADGAAFTTSSRTHGYSPEPTGLAPPLVARSVPKTVSQSALLHPHPDISVYFIYFNQERRLNTKKNTQLQLS